MQQNVNYIEVLERLIGFDTTSYKSNLPLINYVKQYLDHENIDIVINHNEEHNKANLFITTGPKDKAGVLLSGHTDVVPVEGQAWDTDPFEAITKDGKIYGRGTADMKGFIACALVAIKQAADKELSYPLHLCLSYDEEIGCVGVRGILDQISQLIVAPRIVIIGEPTLMKVATSHKGKSVFQVSFFGEEGHSALAPNFKNAIHMASQFVQSLIYSQDTIAKEGKQDTGFDIPYSTIHVGKISGGEAINIVPNLCQLHYEIRNLAEEGIEDIQQLILEEFNKQTFADYCDIKTVNQYPGLLTKPQEPEVKTVQSLLSEPASTTKISFGTEGGLFQQLFDSPIIVCGPGSIEAAHKPNEYIAIDQLKSCNTFLHKLIATLT